MSLDTAVQACLGMNLEIIPAKVIEDCPSVFKFGTLPLKPNLAAATPYTLNLFEHHVRVDPTSLHDVLMNMDTGIELPIPFGSNGVLPPHDLQMALYPSGDGHFNLLKWYRFKSRAQISKVSAKLTGQILFTDMAKLASPKKTPLIMQHLLTHMGGQALVVRELVVSEPSTKRSHD
eukprot:5356798-Amphidinium_carterae.1